MILHGGGGLAGGRWLVGVQGLVGGLWLVGVWRRVGGRNPARGAHLGSCQWRLPREEPLRFSVAAHGTVAVLERAALSSLMSMPNAYPRLPVSVVAAAENGIES